MTEKLFTIKSDNSLLLIVDLQVKLLPTIIDSEVIINNCCWLAKAAQKLSIPTIACEQYPKGLGESYNSIREIVPISQIIDKITFSAARNAMFVDELASHNRKQIIICGIETHVCVLQTALDLKKMGYDIFVVADATASRTTFDRKFALKRMMQNEITIVTNEMVLFEWLEQAGTDLFKEISENFLK